MEPLLEVSDCNNPPALPTKRGSTLLRSTLNRQSMGAEAPLMQPQLVPVPPPLRSNNSSLNNATIRINHPQTVNLL